MRPSRSKGRRGTDLCRCLPGDLSRREPARSGEPVAAALAKAGEARLGISPLVQCECLVGPIKRGDRILPHAYAEFSDRFAPLAMPEEVYLQPAQLRAHCGLKTPDALHLACAQYHGCDLSWTNDDRLLQASHGLARNILK